MFTIYIVLFQCLFKVRKMLFLLLVLERVERDPYLMWRSHLLRRQEKLKKDVRNAELAISKLGAEYKRKRKWHQALEYSLIANFSVKIEEMKKRRDETAGASAIVEEQAVRERQDTRKIIRDLVNERSVLQMEVAQLEQNHSRLAQDLKKKREDLKLSVSNNEAKRDELRASEKKEMAEMQRELKKANAMKAKLEKWLKDREFLRQCKITKKQLEQRAKELSK